MAAVGQFCSHVLDRLTDRFAKTIEIEVSLEEFIYRHKDRENRVATRGYIRRAKGEEPPYQFDRECKAVEDVPISLFSSMPAEYRSDITAILAAFLQYGIYPVCRRNLIAPILIFKGIERFDAAFGFQYAAFRQAGEVFAKEVRFQDLNGGIRTLQAD